MKCPHCHQDILLEGIPHCPESSASAAMSGSVSDTPLTDAALILAGEQFASFARNLERRLHKCESRLHWLHDCTNGTTDAEGYEWGIFRVKMENGQPVSVQHTFSDFSDLDAEMEREQKASKK